MTEAQRLALLKATRADLERTQQGHVQWVEGGKVGGYWKRAEAALNKLEADLEPTRVPALGPVWKGGKAILLLQLTHNTDGVPLYPAFDDAFAQGREIIAPEALTIIAPYTSANPGAAFYAKGVSKIRYWVGHVDRSHPIGKKFVKGQVLAKVAPNPVGGGPHAHWGLNVELLLWPGARLLYGSTGNGPDYTYGSPTVGAQLAKALA